jgi:hypothetical protein
MLPKVNPKKTKAWKTERTWKGSVDRQFMEALEAAYAKSILDLAGATGGEK